MHLNSRPWFVPGKRTGLRRIDPGHVVLLKSGQSHENAADETVFVNELGFDELAGILVDDVPTGHTNAPSSQQGHSQTCNVPRMGLSGHSKRRRREKKDVNTKKYRQSPPVYFDPSEADTSGGGADESSDPMDGLPSSPPFSFNANNAVTTNAAQEEDEEMGGQPLPTSHNRQAFHITGPSSSSRFRSSLLAGQQEAAYRPEAIELSSDESSGENTPDSSEDEGEGQEQERERKRQKRVQKFKNVVIEFAHIGSDGPGPATAAARQDQEMEEFEIPEGFLANLTVAEPFPGAGAFAAGRE